MECFLCVCCWLAQVHQGRIPEEQARRYFQQLIDAVEFCHSKGVYHRDLKPENLLLDTQGCLKISDFGLSALPQQVRVCHGFGCQPRE